jgi:hypothetical protein
MNLPRLTLILTVINTVVLIALVAWLFLAKPPLDGEVLRARVIELVAEDGTVRASLKTESDGQAVLRLLDETGTIRVKLGADQDGSGFVLLDDQTEPGVHILSDEKGGRISLIGEDGAEQVIKP